MMKFTGILFLVLSTLSLYGQKDLPTGQIEVVKDFEVRLIEVNKIKVIPQPITIDTSARIYSYTLTAVAPSIEYEVPELKPLSIEPEQKADYYPLFVKAGYGSPNSLLGQLSYDHNQNENFQWGFDFRHLSADNKKIRLQKFSDSQGRINLNHLVKESMLLEAYFDGHFENVFFYGADEIPTNPDALKRSFKRYDLHLNLSNSPVENASFRFNTIFQFLSDRDDLGARERTLKIGGDAATMIGEDDLPVGLRVIGDFTQFRDVDKKSLNNILVEPYFKYHTNKVKVHLGANILLKPEENEFLPNIELSYSLFPGLSIYGGWKGTVVKNNFHYLSTLNPYIITRLDSIGNEITRKIFGGVKGIAGTVNYDASINYTRFTESAFFLQDFDRPEEFVPVFDDGSFVGIEASLFFDVLKNISLRSSANTRFYTLNNEDKPWHRPTVGVDAMATYSGGSDIYHISLIFHGENGLPYKTPGGSISSTDALIDLNIHADYFVTQSIGTFVQLNNMFGNKRERWSGYPSFGFNVKAGIIFRM